MCSPMVFRRRCDCRSVANMHEPNDKKRANEKTIPNYYYLIINLA